MPALTSEVTDLIESGVSILVGTRNAELIPATVRGVGARLLDSASAVMVFLPVATSERAIANLGENGQIAVGFSRPMDNLSIQIKGQCYEIRPATEDEHMWPERYLIALVETTYTIGLPRGLMRRVNCWPAWAVTFGIRDMYVQTPGPGAGRRLELK